MECYCELELGDPVELLNSKIVTARKNHKCDECQGIIQKRDKYETQTYVFERKIETHKTCLFCLEVRDTYLSSGYHYGSIWENMRECFGDIPLSDFESFQPLVQQKILEML